MSENLDKSKPVTLVELELYCEKRCTMFHNWFKHLEKFQIILSAMAVTMQETSNVLTKSFDELRISFEALRKYAEDHVNKEESEQFYMANPGGIRRVDIAGTPQIDA